MLLPMFPHKQSLVICLSKFFRAVTSRQRGIEPLFQFCLISCGVFIFANKVPAMGLENCWFCSSTVYLGHGITFVRNDTKVFKFCRSKCHKNFKIQQNPRKVKWTKVYRKLHGKEIAQDTTFELERRRNRPERYDRNVVDSTIKAMKKVSEVRVKRESKFWENRMKVKKSIERKEAAAELEQSIHIVKAPLAMQADPTLTLPKVPRILRSKLRQPGNQMKPCKSKLPSLLP